VLQRRNEIKKNNKKEEEKKSKQKNKINQQIYQKKNILF
jgi:hypothetical protein